MYDIDMNDYETAQARALGILDLGCEPDYEAICDAEADAFDGAESRYIVH